MLILGMHLGGMNQRRKKPSIIPRTSIPGDPPNARKFAEDRLMARLLSTVT